MKNDEEEENEARKKRRKKGATGIKFSRKSSRTPTRVSGMGAWCACARARGMEWCWGCGAARAGGFTGAVAGLDGAPLRKLRPRTPLSAKAGQLRSPPRPKAGALFA